MFVVNSDCNVLTRLDAYVTNMKMPWYYSYYIIGNLNRMVRLLFQLGLLNAGFRLNQAHLIDYGTNNIVHKLYVYIGNHTLVPF